MARKFTDESIVKLATQLKNDYAPRNKRIQDVRDAINGNYKLPVPEQFVPITIKVDTRLSADTKDRVVAILNAGPLIVRVRPYDTTKDAEQNSEARELWANALIQELVQRQGFNPFNDLTEYMTGDGYGALKVLHMPDVWGDVPTPAEDEDDKKYLARTEDIKRRSGPPLLIQSPDPTTLYPVYGDTGMVAMLEICRRGQMDLMDRYHVIPGAKGKLVEATGAEYIAYLQREGLATSYTKTSEWIEFWDEEWAVYLADGKVIHKFEHKYGRPPYFYSHGLSSLSRHPYERGSSIVDNLIDDERNLNWNLTIKQIWAAIGGMPIAIRIRGPEWEEIQGEGEEEGQKKKETLVQHLGGVMELEQGGQYFYLSPPPIGADLNQMAQIYQSNIDRKGISPVLGGHWPGSDTGGYMYAQMRRQGKSIFDPLMQNANSVLSQAMSHIFFLVEKVINTEVPVWGYRTKKGQRLLTSFNLGPEQINGYYQCEVIRKADPDSDDVSKGTYAALMVEKGMMELQYALEHYMDRENPLQVMDAIDEDKMMKNPIVQQALVLYNLKRTGLGAALGILPDENTGAGGGPSPLPGATPPIGPGLGGVPLVEPVPPVPEGPPLNVSVPSPAIRGRPAGASRRPGGPNLG